MPELPEVETTLRGIAPHLINRRIVGVRIYDRRLRWPVPPDFEMQLLGRSVSAVNRRSKYLLLDLGNPSAGTALLIHLGMTGSLRIHAVPPAKRPHDHVDLTFDRGVTLRYHDPRRFGCMLLIPSPVSDHPLLASLGPEPFSSDFHPDYLYQALRNRSTAIKLALMDNHVVVGVGNIYANEALFRAGIHPIRSANRISRQRLSRLVESVQQTLSEAIAKGGSTLRDYVDGNGQPGYFQHHYYAYGRGGLPCRICGTILRETRLGGRATSYCPQCQR